MNESALTQQDSSNATETEKISDTSETRPIGTEYSEADLIEFLKSVAITYGLDYEKLYNTVEDESSFNPNAVGPGGVSIGVAQYTLDTWLAYCDNIDSRTDPYKSLDCMGKMWSQNLEYRWDAYCHLYEDLNCINLRGLYPK